MHKPSLDERARRSPPRSHDARPTTRTVDKNFLRRLLIVGLVLAPGDPSRAASRATHLPFDEPLAIELHDSREGGRTLRLSPPKDGASGRTPLGAGWRHDFDLVLTVDGSDLVVRDGTHARRVFPKAASGTRRDGARHAGRDPADGGITVRDGRIVWTRSRAGDDVTFAGSLPVRLDASDGRVTTLHYDAGRLVEVVHPDDEGVTRFTYGDERVERITFPDGTSYSVSVDADGTLHTSRQVECGPDHADSPDTTGSGGAGDTDDDASPPVDHASRCDTASNPPPPSFARPGIAGATLVDARPRSCGSYFVDHHGTERGSAIENGLDGLPHYAGFSATVRSFPVVDFVGEELRVVRSRDLSSPSYDALPDGLFDRLLRDGDEIARDLLVPLARDGLLGVTESGRTTTLVHRPARPVVLELVVRHGIASADQEAQIRRAALELASRHGVELRVIEIP